MNNFGEKVSFIWSIADLLRDTFKRSKYQDVILPLTVLRRIDCVLDPTKEDVIKRYKTLKGKLDDLDNPLSKASGYAFYNISPFNFERLLQDAPNLSSNLRAYINAFSTNMKEVLEKFDFENTIAKLDESGLLFLVMEKFKNIDFHPDQVSNLEMGYIFEELIRKFNEALNENPGEHFTPREVIRLMVNILLSEDKGVLSKEYITRTVYDPCCGSGGMLTIAKARIQEINPKSDIHLFGQEVNPETFAVCKSDLYMKSADGRDAEGIKYGSTLSNDQHSNKQFDYLLTNPPYGKDWKMDKVAVETEAEKGYSGRFGAGTPRISDGQLLFLQHMLGRMRDPDDGGSRIAIVMNGSPLFTGDAASGESEIRRWILENDFLEIIVALPEQLFYNTGIATYVWVLTNRKDTKKKRKVQLIDATSFWVQMRKSLGNKRREISPEHIDEITRISEQFGEREYSKIFDTTEFGFRKLTIDRPLRLNFQVNRERLQKLRMTSQFMNLALSKKKDPKEILKEEEQGRKQQEKLVSVLSTIPNEVYMDKTPFEKILNETLEKASVKIGNPLKKAILFALSERDENAEICLDDEGHPEPDTELRDTENVPLKEDIRKYFEREVNPHVPDAWINEGIRDYKDGEIGKVGYEINFNRYFYKYQPPRPLDEIESDIRKIEKEILDMLGEIAQ